MCMCVYTYIYIEKEQDRVKEREREKIYLRNWLMPLWIRNSDLLSRATGWRPSEQLTLKLESDG